LDVAILLYDNFTALDAVGPYEVLSRLPGARAKFVAPVPGPVRTDTRALAITADYALGDLPRPDIIVVPGGPGDEGAMADKAVLDWLRSAHETTKWTTSVCTGALVLGAAGLLDGLEATTHWAAYGRLAALGATPTARRVVRQGKVITAAGVSAGIDMALDLARLEAGEEFAQALQLGIEYDPQPPLDAGSPDKAPAHVVEMVRSVLSPSS
jgi:transcriptional regulator GlxA family with amidase domain